MQTLINNSQKTTHQHSGSATKGIKCIRIAKAPAVALEILDYSPLRCVLKPSSSFQCLVSATDDFLNEILSQLHIYASGLSMQVDVSLPEGSIGSLLRQIRDIPFGQVRTYGHLNNYNPRLVGVACRLNPVPLLIPCHRVVGAKGLGGFAYGLDLKRKLLAFEGHC